MSELKSQISEYNYDDLEEEFSYQNFQKYILQGKQNFGECVEYIKKGDLGDLQIRFNVWRILLKNLPVSDNQEEIKNKIEEQRREYQKNYQTFKNQSKIQKTKDVKEKKEKKPFNPLAPAPTKKANNEVTVNLNDDSHLKYEIKKDVERTYQDRQFFLQPEIKQMLTNILFVWSKMNPEISYRQGMNELVASFIVIYYQELLEIEKGKPENVEQDIYDIAQFMINKEGAEADIFWAFNQIMALGQDQMFVHKEDNKGKPNSKINTPILLRLAKIQDYFLKIVDIDLFRHLKLVEVQFSTFLLKWVKCIFTREFPMHLTFGLWDIILLDQFLYPNQKLNNLVNLNYDVNNLLMIDCIVLGMLLMQKYQVMDIHDSAQCMKVYIQYPEIENMKQLIQVAIEIKQRLLQFDPNAAEELKKQNKQFQVFNPENPLVKNESSLGVQKKEKQKFNSNNPLQDLIPKPNNNASAKKQTKIAGNTNEKDLQNSQNRSQEKKDEEINKIQAQLKEDEDEKKQQKSTESSQKQQQEQLQEKQEQQEKQEKKVLRFMVADQPQKPQKPEKSPLFKKKEKKVEKEEKQQEKSKKPLLFGNKESESKNKNQNQNKQHIFSDDDDEEEIQNLTPQNSDQNLNSSNNIIIKNNSSYNNSQQSNGVKIIVSNSDNNSNSKKNSKIKINNSNPLSGNSEIQYKLSQAEIQQLLKAVTNSEKFINENNQEQYNLEVLEGLEQAKKLLNKKLGIDMCVVQQDEFVEDKRTIQF